MMIHDIGFACLVQSFLDLFELFWAERARIDAFDLSTKVYKLASVCGCWEGKRDEFYSHGRRRVQRGSRGSESERVRLWSPPVLIMFA
jgi:hypothetical protein